QKQPDIMIVATPGEYGLCGAWLASRKQIPFLTGFHTSFEKLTELYWPDSLRGKIVEFYFRHSNAYLFKRSEAVLGNSASILRQASAMGAPQVKLIGTPISAEFAQHPLADYHGKFQKLLFAGRLAKEKNIEAIIDCAAQLPQLNFSIAGDGPLRDLVLEAAGNLENLDYLGWLSRDDLRRTVDSHDALLLPSWFETFGTIALESMARQRPVIVSRGCGISDWPDLAETLFVIGRDENLYATLLSIMQMPRQKRLEKVAAAYNAALAFNNRVAKSWCELLTDTLNHYHAGHNFHS
ncbi:MAG: glycosyltransferase, partial [Pseudohongiellaceae bacterium]